MNINDYNIRNGKQLRFFVTNKNKNKNNDNHLYHLFSKLSLFF